MGILKDILAWIRKDYYETVDDAQAVVDAVEKATDWALSWYGWLQEKFESAEKAVDAFLDNTKEMLSDIEDSIEDGSQNAARFALNQIEVTTLTMRERLIEWLEDLHDVDCWIDDMYGKLDDGE